LLQKIVLCPLLAVLPWCCNAFRCLNRWQVSSW